MMDWRLDGLNLTRAPECTTLFVLIVFTVSTWMPQRRMIQRSAWVSESTFGTEPRCSGLSLIPLRAVDLIGEDMMHWTWTLSSKGMLEVSLDSTRYSVPDKVAKYLLEFHASDYTGLGLPPIPAGSSSGAIHKMLNTAQVLLNGISYFHSITISFIYPNFI